MKNLNISKLFLGFIAIMAVLIAVQSMMMIAQTKKIERDMLYNSEVLIPIIKKAKEARIAVAQVQQGLADLSIASGQNGLDDGLAEAELAAKKFKRLMKELSEIHPANIGRYKNIIPYFEKYYKDGEAMAQEYVKRGPAAGNKLMDQFDLSAVTINKKIDEILLDIDKEIESSVAHELADNSGTFYLIIGFTLSYIFLLVTLFLLTRVYIIKPAEYLAEQLGYIAKGDFSKKVESKRNDEIGAIAKAAGDIVFQLGNTLREIASSGMQVSAYSHALTYIMDTSRQHLEMMSAENHAVAKSSEELALLGVMVEEQANQASLASTEVKQQAQIGDELLGETVSASSILAERMNQAKVTVQELSDSSNKINDVMAVIQGIAEQTNLLALNAAIEAARAGEQGRGFAVVADEVRTLASRTQESASQINEMIQTLQVNARETVELIAQNQTQASSNAESSEKALEALKNIIKTINKIDRLSTEISQAATQQKVKSSEVESNIQRSNRLSEQFNEKSKQSNRFSEKLSEHAHKFSNLASKLKIY